jgi:hypothetical protein
MAKLIYFMPTSLEGYIADETGNPDWAPPDEEVFAFINDLYRPIGMYLYGRKIYETMTIWETPDVIPVRTPAMMDFARAWQAADKIVYSKSLETVSTSKTHLAREFGAPGGSRPQGSIASRYFGGRSDPRRTGDSCRPRRRVSSARRAHYAWGRQPGPAQERMRKAGSPGRAPLY